MKKQRQIYKPGSTPIRFIPVNTNDFIERDYYKVTKHFPINYFNTSDTLILSQHRLIIKEILQKYNMFGGSVHINSNDDNVYINNVYGTLVLNRKKYQKRIRKFKLERILDEKLN